MCYLGGVIQRWQKTFFLSYMISMAALFSSCSSLLYYPTRQLHFPPEQFGLHPEEVNFRSGDGTALFGWLFRHAAPDALAKPRGVILFYHGNGENLSSHYISLLWALKQGFDFFIFDYRGYGRSEGEPSPQGTVHDGEAALRWLNIHYPQSSLIIYGQSLGGAVALRNAIDLKDEIPYRAVVIDSSFSSYQDIGRRVMAKAIFTWPLQWLSYLALSDKYAPGTEIEKIAPRPILVIHAEHDETVPFACGEQIFALAKDPKEFWKIPGGGHTDSFLHHGDIYQKKFLAWIEPYL